MRTTKSKSPVPGIRNAVAQDKRRGYILGCDPKKEREDILHGKLIQFDSGKFASDDLNFDAHSCCIIDVPKPALVFIASQGDYGVIGEDDDFGNIFRSSEPKPKKPRAGVFWSVSEISGKAYAVGHKGMIYRYDAPGKWTRADDGLPSNFDITAIDGFDASDMFAVGYSGALWSFDGRRWKEHHLPTNVHLHSVKCAEDGTVYAAGREGVLVSGKNQRWKVVGQETTRDTLWDIEWFQGKLYVSTSTRVYWLSDAELVLVDFGDDKPQTCSHLSAAKDVMWSIGEKDIMCFDGRKWVRIV